MSFPEQAAAYPENSQSTTILVLGILGLVCALVVLVVLGGAASIASFAAVDEPDAAVAAPVLVTIGIFLSVFIAVLSVPGLAVGIGIVKFRVWGRVGGIVLSVLNLLNVPFGTVLGIYGLWVLLAKESEPLFD